jgi:hypothetical protein
VKRLLRWHELDSGTLLRVLVFCAIFSLAALPPIDPDLFWHLTNGQVILQVGWPHTDLYSFSAHGHPWVMHEWLADLGMALMVRAGGLPLLVAIFAGLVTITAGCLYWLLRRGGVHATMAAVLTVAGALAGSTAWGARPQVVNVLFFALLACGLVRYRDGALAAWWLAPFLWVWANVHSGFLSGVVLVGLFLVGEGFEAWRAQTPTAWTRLRGLAFAWLAGVGLAFINPYGWDAVAFPFGTLSSSLIQNNIQEWASPDFHSLTGQLLEGLLFVLLAGVATGRVRARATEWLWTLAFLFLGLASQRQVPLFVLAAAPLIGRSADALLAALAEVLPRQPGQPAQRAAFVARPLMPVRGRATTVINIMILVGVAASMLGYRALPNLLPAHQAASIAAVYPVAGADALLQQGRPLRVLNYYDYGGYLIYRLWPSGSAVFIDGRVEVYGPALFSDYLTLSYAAPGWRAVVQRYQPDAIVLPTWHPLVGVLLQDPDWRTLSRDRVATVFIGNVAGSR